MPKSPKFVLVSLPRARGMTDPRETVMTTIFETILLLLFAHAVGDFALQSDSMARGKNRHAFDPSKAPPGQKPCNCWFWWMTAHALVNGAMYFIFTQNIIIGIIETVAHLVIDIVKTENKTSPHQDQLLHLACAVIYSIIVFMVGFP